MQILGSQTLPRGIEEFSGRDIYHETMDEDKFIAGDLLQFSKSGIKNVALALTETATPYVRQVLVKHLLAWVRMHERIFNYLLARRLYPAYNLQEILQTDFSQAQMALHMPIHR